MFRGGYLRVWVCPEGVVCPEGDGIFKGSCYVQGLCIRGDGYSRGEGCVCLGLGYQGVGIPEGGGWMGTHPRTWDLGYPPDPHY